MALHHGCSLYDPPQDRESVDTALVLMACDWFDCEQLREGAFAIPKRLGMSP
jgi:hypothetical protein